MICFRVHTHKLKQYLLAASFSNIICTFLPLVDVRQWSLSNHEDEAEEWLLLYQKESQYHMVTPLQHKQIGRNVSQPVLT